MDGVSEVLVETWVSQRLKQDTLKGIIRLLLKLGEDWSGCSATVQSIGYWGWGNHSQTPKAKQHNCIMHSLCLSPRLDCSG